MHNKAPCRLSAHKDQRDASEQFRSLPSLMSVRYCYVLMRTYNRKQDTRYIDPCPSSNLITKQHEGSIPQRA